MSASRPPSALTPDPSSDPGAGTARTDDWREALQALRALAGEPGAAPEDAAGGAPRTRLLWMVSLEPDGAVAAIEPLEQSQGARGWGKPRPVALARLAESESLGPDDARVARAIRPARGYGRRFVLDRAAAMLALIGHPGVVLAGRPEQPLAVEAGEPVLEVVREPGHYLLRAWPPVRESRLLEGYLDAAARQEAETLRQITVVRDGPQRLRVVRHTPAQLAAGRVLARGLPVPLEAQAELDGALRALAAHFQVQADQGGLAFEVAPEHRLRAELAPHGRGVALRLVVTPLGPLGPRLAPGAGRERLLATIQGETRATRRDLAAEQAHVAECFHALPELVPLASDDGELQWTLDDPEIALAVLEQLPGLAGVQALEWPKGRAMRVLGAGLPQLAVRVAAAGEWFKLAGELTVAEGMVLELERLLAWAAGHPGRFVPMGDGLYVALTRELRGRLRDLAAVAAPAARDGGLRVPAMAAPWLDDVLAGAGIDPDRHFRERVARLRQARAAAPAPLPATLAAELRPYQQDGYRWAMQLAQAGFGACLADDMGLGKTVQALAVLVARAGGGAALVVAPTSVCGNWLEEARRFAPSLRVHDYAGDGRQAVLAQAGAGDLVVVSYTLLQQARADFCAQAWHTVVADEAQSFKNAGAKRAQAMFALRADFRLVLSGTPLENRLAELWSVMRFCNPGLLGSLVRFNEHFAAPIEQAGAREPRLRLRRMIAPFVLRRTKAEVLEELPARTERVLRIEPDPLEAAHYEALRRQAETAAEQALRAAARARRPGAPSAAGGTAAPAAGAAASEAEARLHVLAQLTRMRRAACDARLVTPELERPGAKVRAFVALAQELAAAGHRALVFSQFVDFLQLLRAALDEAGLRWQYLDGATPAAERTRRVAAFQAGEGDCFLISLKAGGFGLNLTAADYVIITDPWWNPAAEDQAMGRAHRIGQQRPVTVYRLIGAGTVEEGIVALHQGKRELADGILAAGEGAAAPLPDVDELVMLLRR
ncbi:DNA helicase [Cupriavidus sp. USMAA2-4]|uniref:DEAD/DEAH box helicase n=1 Tax=Cupriavidus sp. USMAA2-4 TaxID=876364 RepID=UPI0008A667CB|nr:DEAD/DEAH box helicase [Cupriavidus sp. USMAA2-4]AOY91667.1 DNA helicase [Cupriavidus sp. USMAA2-4]